jgi:alpha-tubulin suppressor-like RCC1 family protein
VSISNFNYKWTYIISFFFRRGQLGHGEIINEETPKLIEALAGIKIIDIGANGWHSAAVSAFGDLYTWGWNSHGQLGIPVFDQKKHSTSSSFRHKNPAVYPLPQLIDFDDEANITSVACGSKHTLVKAETNEIFSCGWNKYGQLGLEGREDVKFEFLIIESEAFVDKFSKIEGNFEDFHVRCGYMCSMLVK